MNNKIESLTVWTVVSFGVLGIFVLSGCTLNLPATNEPIPTADPILFPEKATTGNSSNSSATNTNSNAKPTEVVPSSTTVSTVSNQSGGNEKVTNPRTNLPSQGQTYYVVKPKDTVFEVMRQTGVHWKEIIRLNNLKAPKYTIFPGQSLRIR